LASDQYAPDLQDAVTGLIFVFVGILIVLCFPLLGIGSIVHFVPKEGISAFAVAYLEAQLIERIIEPINGIFGNKKQLDKLRNQSRLSSANKKTVDKLETRRTFSIWGFASLLGMLLSYLTVGLFATIGATFVSQGFGMSFDAILSGIIVGGGTKPLHDIIEYMNNPKAKS